MDRIFGILEPKNLPIVSILALYGLFLDCMRINTNIATSDFKINIKFEILEPKNLQSGAFVLKTAF